MESTAWLIVSFLIFHVWTTSEAPELTVTPTGEYYLTGQPVTLTCLRSEYFRGVGLDFLKDKTELNSSWGMWKPSDSYYIPQLKISDTGEYSCKYWKGPTTYLESNPVRITVLEPPRPPLFSVSPKREVYRSKEFITLICSIPDHRLASKIMFYRNGRQLALLQPSSSLDTLMPSLLLFPQDGANYSCRYQIMESKWEILSAESNFVSVSVMVGVQNPSVQPGYAALAVLLPILMAPLVCYCRRRKKASKHRQTLGGK